MMKNGYIKLHRKLLDCSVFQNEKLLKVWIWCLLKASHEEHELIIGNTIVKVKEGQFIYGKNRAFEETKIPVATFWRYMNLLQDLNMITLEATNKWTLATITNWSAYQLTEVEPKWNANETEKSLKFQQPPEVSEPQAERKWNANGTIQEYNNNNNKRPKKSKAERNVIPPSLEMVTDYCIKRKNRINPQYFIDYYETRDWCVGKNKMKDWQAAIRTWENNDRQRNQNQAPVVTEVKRYDV